MADVRELLGEEIPEIARLVPQLSRLFPDVPPPLELPIEQSRRALFNAFTRVLMRKSTHQPIILVLEDLHWADEGTLSLLTHIGGLIGKMPILIVGTYRDFELRPNRRLAKVIEELIRLHTLEQISLGGLSRTAVVRMIEMICGSGPPEDIPSLVYSETQGNPFFVEELLQHPIEQHRLLDEVDPIFETTIGHF